MRGGLEEARRLVADARAVAVLTGAGISAESGVPTFRGPAGLWRSFRPEELATPGAFRRDPQLVWSWYRWRRGLVGGCAPNDGHRALARFALTHGGVTLVTQNVDGLHQRAARDEAGEADPAPALPYELHGSLLRDRCSDCGRRSEAEVPEPDAAESPVPRCSGCDGLLRPDVVWFGEMLDTDTLQSAFNAAAACDLCLVVGTSSLVYPAASVPSAALNAGVPVIEVNPEPTPLSPHARVVLRGP
ncbi:MAG: NAD-dependent deacylase, partial [Gemmatimonadota bacterium]